MKQKLTLTVKKSIIDAAKKRAKNKGISLSECLRKILKKKVPTIKTEHQRAAESFTSNALKLKSLPTKEDKELINSHVKRKFA